MIMITFGFVLSAVLCKYKNPFFSLLLHFMTSVFISFFKRKLKS